MKPSPQIEGGVESQRHPQGHSVTMMFNTWSNSHSLNLQGRQEPKGEFELHVEPEESQITTPRFQ